VLFVGVPRRGRVKLIGALLFLLLILSVGTLGYRLLEPQVNWFQAFYMTVITISTVGFGEIPGLGLLGRAFTVALIICGIGLVSYVFFAISQTVVEGEIMSYFGRRKLDKRIAALKDHVVLCGFGRVGEIVAAELRKFGRPFIVVEQDPEQEEALERRKFIYVIGDAAKDDVLKQAGIERARALIACTHPDAQNIYITLTARELNSKLKILSRAYEEDAEKRLFRAGADRVIYPDRIGGMRIALSLLKPALMSFMEVLAESYEDGEIEVDEFTIGERCSIIGRSLIEAQFRQSFNLIVIAIRRADGAMQFNPGRDAVIEVGDTLIAIGMRGDLKEFAHRIDAQEVKA